MLTQLRASLHSTVPYGFFTPLAGIIGLIQILRSDLRKLSPDEIQSILKDMDNTAHRLHRRLRNYLLLLDLPADTQEEGRIVQLLLPREARDAILAGVKTAADRTQRMKDIMIEVADAEFAATPTDLCVIVEELVDNACNYSRRGTPVEVKLTAEGVLTISDAGRGMGQEELRRIGAFRQSDLGWQESPGMGLGLPLVEKLAAKCGAKLTLASTEGHGTRVTVSFSRDLPVAL
jgi:signal transduction histidine kinase